MRAWRMRNSQARGSEVVEGVVSLGRSAGRPVEFSSAKKVEMKMRDGFASVWAVIENKTVAGV